MKTFLTISLLALLVCSGYKTYAGVDGTKLELFSTISTKGVTNTTLDEAIAKLPKSAKESPRYWSQIANDPGYSIYHRRRAAVQLFKRHIHAKIRLSELARLLNRPTWLRATDINVINYLGGQIPVEWNLKDTVFVIVLPTIGPSNSAIYLRLTGEMDVQRFRKVVLDPAKANAGNSTIAEIATCEWDSVRREETIYRKGSEFILKY